MTATRVGLVGAGGGAQRHARVLSGFSDVQLVGVTDVLPEAAERLAGAHGTRSFPDVRALLAEGLDALYVCVPPFPPRAPERAAVAAGVPLFVEKPVGVDSGTPGELARLIGERGLLTAV